MVFELLKRAFERLKRRIEREKELMMIRFARWAYQRLKPWLFVSRYSLAYRFPVHRKYKNVLTQLWVTQARRQREREKLEDEAREFTHECVEEFTGYERREWWFEFEVLGEGWQLVTEYPELNVMVCRIEDEETKVVLYERWKRV